MKNLTFEQFRNGQITANEAVEKMMDLADSEEDRKFLRLLDDALSDTEQGQVRFSSDASRFIKSRRH